MKERKPSFKCEPVKIASVPGLKFEPTIGRRAFWVDQINLLRGDPDLMLKILASDKSSITQLQVKAKKENVRLLWAQKDDFLFVRAWVPSEAQARLTLLLREPRTVNELKARGLELNLEAELEALAKRGMCAYKAGKWQLTSVGLNGIGAAHA